MMKKDAEIGKYSIGIGDRFGKEGCAQLRAVMAVKGVTVTPVWNKSYREHVITGTRPEDVRKEADEAVRACGWNGPYFVDADHVGLQNIDGFIASSDFFTLDVAECIGREPDEARCRAFTERNKRFTGGFHIPGMEAPLRVTERHLEDIAHRYLRAVEEAGKIFRHIVNRKASVPFVVEVSMDETSEPQTPAELFFILEALSSEKIPVMTIAPRFSGRFNKGVDYAGDVSLFAQEFSEDIAVVAFAVHAFALPATLKLSIHSGSDKFSIYGPVREAMKRYDAGVHLKTAGTTWLEELIGLAEEGGKGFEIAKRIYRSAFSRIAELCGPYAAVIDIRRERVPEPRDVDTWNGEHFAAALRHDPENQAYCPDFRQLLHVSYRVAAEMGEEYTAALAACQPSIAKNVTENLYERHIKPLFCS